VSSSNGLPPAVVVGLGDPSLERQVLAALDPDASAADDQVTIARRCMTAAEVLACLHRGEADAAVLGTGLQGLGADVADALRDLGRPVVALVPAGGEEWWRERLPTARVVVATRTLDAALVRSTLAEALAAASGSRRRRAVRPSHTPVAERGTSSTGPAVLERAEGAGGKLVDVLGPPGGVGVTTTAINVAAVLGRMASTLLIDLRMGAASVASALDLDSRRNVYMLAYAAPADEAAWQRAFDLEVQPLHPSSPHGFVLAGLPTTLPGLQVGRSSLDSLLKEARQRWSFVVVDGGVVPLTGGVDGSERVALGAADQVLLVSGCDLVSLQRTQVALERLEGIGIGGDVANQRLLVVANRHDERFHHDRAELGGVLQAPLAAVVPEDRAAQRALSEQQPLVSAAPRGRAARALADVASVVADGRQLAAASRRATGGRPRGGMGTRGGRGWRLSGVLPSIVVGRLFGGAATGPQAELP
jgi:Flp pilus assembly CpaE family ATPase